MTDEPADKSAPKPDSMLIPADTELTCPCCNASLVLSYGGLVEVKEDVQ